MHESVAATRAGLIMALAYTLPLLLWLIGQAILSSAGRFDFALSLGGMMTAALLLQSCALALGLPWLMRFRAGRARCCAVAMSVLVPAPLYAVAGLSGVIGWTALAIALATLAALALLLYGIYTACLTVTVAGTTRSLLIVCTQALLLALCWEYRDLWQRVLSQ